MLNLLVQLIIYLLYSGGAKVYLADPAQDSGTLQTAGACIPSEIRLRADTQGGYRGDPKRAKHEARDWGLSLPTDIHKISVLTRGNRETFQIFQEVKQLKRMCSVPVPIPVESRDDLFHDIAQLLWNNKFDRG